MNKKLIGFAEQALFASVVFVLFLLLFNGKFVVPVWLQPLGRMHPLLLHFPIVILLLAMVMEAFRSRTSSVSNPAFAEFYQHFLSSLLLIGALSAGLTVIMGLFLAKEDGYSGQVLTWHKWSGVAIFFMASFLYWARPKVWYTAMIARLGAAVTVLCLIGAGHYGATLTHGDNFLFEPISRLEKPAPVAFDKAMVYADVIQPIFEQKCISCHNADKLKGQLNLATIDAMLKGGKTGKLFVAGKPDMSLLLERIHMPMEEKKHMPPSGKTQLTPQEMTLLALWVKGNAEHKKKLIDLPATDSLRLMASALFKPAEPVEQFDFDPADEETVKKLNNDYRTVAPLARESPALAVNLYNKDTYSPEKLAELSPVKEQVVYLNLNKMPVKDADLKRIAEFDNLQKLDLNFTDITGSGLSELDGLSQLKTLALSGTNITFDVLQKQLGNFKKLQTISLWNTKLTPVQIGQLQKVYRNIQFIAGFDGADSAPITLNPPQIKNSSTIFTGTVPLQLKHPIKGVQIRYTTDGTEPDSLHSPVFTNQTVLSQPTLVKAKAYKAGWYGSTVATFDFYKSTYKPDSVNLLFPLNPVHQADGAHTFFDGRLGTFNANSPAWANNWGGFRKYDMALVSEFKKPISVSSVALRVMVEEETSIFPPEVVEIWGGNSREKMTLLGTLKPGMPVKKEKPILKAVVCAFKPQTVSFLKVIAKPVKKLPDWHPNKGNNALLLVDEVFIN
ncbi:c-type cytochrome domain-containing protein [Spirosoma aerophilum]